MSLDRPLMPRRSPTVCARPSTCSRAIPSADESRHVHAKLLPSLFAMVLTLSLVLLLSPPLVALAGSTDDPAQEEEAKLLVVELKGLRKQKDSAKLATALDHFVKLHNELTSKSTRHALQHVVGQVLSDKKMADDRVPAAEALGKINDARGGYKHLKRSMPTPKTELAGVVEIAALRAVGSLAPDAAIPALLDLMTKGKDNNVSKEAIQALGNFGTSKKRVVVLEDMVKYMSRSKPRYTPGKRVGAATRARWSAIGRSFIRALNHLTGQEIRSADDWMDQYKAQKKRPKNLFVDED